MRGSLFCVHMCVCGGLSASYWQRAHGSKGAMRLRSQQLGRLESMPVVWVWVSVCVLAKEYHGGLPTSRTRGLAARYWSGHKQPEGLRAGYGRDCGIWGSAAGKASGETCLCMSAVMGRPGIQGPGTGENQQLSPAVGGIRRTCVCLCRYAKGSEYQQRGLQDLYVQVPAKGEIEDHGKLLDRLSKSTSATGEIVCVYTDVCMYMYTYMHTHTCIFH